MFKRFQINNIVKNKELLRSFNFETIPTSCTQLLKITKTTGARPLSFVVDMNKDFNYFWNLLKQPFFPSSLSILTKLGKDFLRNYDDNFEVMLSDAHLGDLEDRNFFSDNAVRIAVIEKFRYLNISVDLTKPFSRTKTNILIDEDLEHPLINYFMYSVLTCTYEKEVFDAVIKLFKIADDVRNSVDAILKGLVLENNDLILRSLFNRRDDGSVQFVNYGEALVHACSGGEVLKGNVSWSQFNKSQKTNLLENLESINLGQIYIDQIEQFEQKALLSRQNTLTAESASHYNIEVPNVHYWNI